MKQQICLRPNATIKQSQSHKRPLINISPKEKTLHSSMSNIICKSDYITGNFETKARNLAMRPQVCWRPSATITQSLLRTY